MEDGGTTSRSNEDLEYISLDGETPRNRETRKLTVDIYVDFLASVKLDHRQVSVSVVGSLSLLWRDEKTKVAKIEFSRSD